MENKEFEVIVIGGSYSGLSAAMTLGRSLRRTLIIDSGNPCNRQTPHSHNFLTQDGSTPLEIATIAKEQVAKYDTVHFYTGMAANGRKVTKGFEVITADAEVFRAKKLVLATGIKDILPSIKGFEECWGISVIHCPYCHGFEHKDQKTAILSNGDMAVHLAPLINNLSNEIVILTNGKSAFDKEQLEKLHKHDIEINEKEIAEMVHHRGMLEAIVFKDGTKESFKVAYASLPFDQTTTIPSELGCELTDQGYVAVDFMQKTSEYGVYACGDNSTMMRSVATAVYSGNVAGAAINKELAEESF